MKDKILEETAKLCHKQWTGWMKYLFKKGVFNENGTWSMPKEFVERWLRQTNTEYEELPEYEKESDRIEAYNYINLFKKLML